MALTKAQRAERTETVLHHLTSARRHREKVTLTLQKGRKRPTVTGYVKSIATTRAFVLLRRDDHPVDPDAGEDERDPLHVPVDIIRHVKFHRRRTAR